jgi:hypothetical protein
LRCRDRDIRCSGYDRRGGDGRCYALVTGGHQSKAVGKRVGTCIRRGKLIVKGKDGGAIGAGEVYGAVDNPVPASRGHGGNRNGKG